MKYLAIYGDTPESRIIRTFNSVDEAKAFALRQADLYSRLWTVIDENGRMVEGFGMEGLNAKEPEEDDPGIDTAGFAEIY